MIWSCTFTQLLCGPISSKVVCHWISYSRWDFTLCLWFSLQLDQKFRYWLALAIIRIVRSRHVSGCVVLWYLQWCPPCDNEQAYGNVIWRKLHIQCPLQPRIFSCLVFSDETRPLHQPKRANRHEYMTIWRLLSNCSTISFFSRCNDQEIYGRCYIKRVASLMTSTTEDWFLMGVDLCTNRNGPIGAKLWQSDMCVHLQYTILLFQMQQPTNVQPALHQGKCPPNDLENQGLLSTLCFLMGIDLCTDWNEPVGVKLWKYEDVCPTAAYFPPPDEVHWLSPLFDWFWRAAACWYLHFLVLAKKCIVSFLVATGSV